MTELPDAVGLDGIAGDYSDDQERPPEPTADDDEVEPVELLVQLAEEGEIEPWDIDIVEVTDAFLSKLEATDLRTSARALFYASVLLRMKGDELLDPTDDEPADEPEPWEQAFEDDGAADEGGAPGFDPVDELEAEMDRRLDRKSTRGNPETLDELVRELREAERDNWWKRRREYDTSGSSGGTYGTQTVDYRAADDFREDDEPTEGDVTANTHTEDIDHVIEQVQAALEPEFDNGRSEVLYAEIESAGGRPFMTYLALLFLSHRGELRLQQDDLFGDLWVQDPEQVSQDEAAEPDDEIEATAD
ncbi:segregation/condensation protein A [Halonotius terrestris]|uniref:Segregation/condensation protein A n=1 Tax=Halonotius terrestris TaxID=2487750 RepID=A0A8J8TDI4_9EURY|nr:ScpA family protein [Halonotius terrestris]TQQ83561.1 segregation/condensation protein A [Halonotius terrestris]